MPITRARIFCESHFAARRRVVAERRKATVVGRPELIDRNVAGGLEHAVADHLGRLDHRVDGRDHADEHPLPRFEALADVSQHPLALLLACQRDVEVSDAKLEQAGQQVGVVDVGAVRRITVATGAGVHADASALVVGKARQRHVVQVDEAVQEVAARVELDRQPAFREIDLHCVGAQIQARPDLRLMLAEEVGDELLARVVGDLVGGIHEAQRRRRNHRLLDRNVRVAQREAEIGIGADAVPERTAEQAQHAARVARGERDREAVRGNVVQALHAVGPEVVELALLAIGDDRRPGGLEAPDGVEDGVFVEWLERRIGAVAAGQGLDQRCGARDAADRLGGNLESHRDGDAHSCAIEGERIEWVCLRKMSDGRVLRRSRSAD